MKINKLKETFEQNNNILKTSKLNELGFDSRKINKLIEDDAIERIKYGYYILADSMPDEKVVISKLFPEAVIFLESALYYYGYTERVPNKWQIAVEKHSNPDKFNNGFMQIEPFFIVEKFHDIGISEIKENNSKIKIYDLDKTICDVLRYEKKLDNEVFTNAIKKYINDENKNVNNLVKYSKKLNIYNKMQTYIGVWL